MVCLCTKNKTDRDGATELGLMSDINIDIAATAPIFYVYVYRL
jgi:hypothetical protein